MVYELRIYHVAPGKMANLLARFRNPVERLFKKHGVKTVACWTGLEEPTKSNTFIYIVEHESREAAAATWKAFAADPDWQSAKAKSEENGKLVDKIDATFLALTDFSPQLK
jgi:hypothetical protein